MAQCGPLMTLGKKPFENIVEKGENACESMFRFSHNILYCIKLHHLSLFSNCHLQMLSLLRRLNFCCLINGKQNASLRFQMESYWLNWHVWISVQREGYGLATLL